MDTVAEARRRCEVEEGRSNDSIFHCKDLLTHMKIKHLKEEVAQGNSATKDDPSQTTSDWPPELEQLEKLLQKAFRARNTAANSGDTSTSTFKNRSTFSASSKPQSQPCSKDNLNSKRTTQTTNVQTAVRCTQGNTRPRGQPARGAQLGRAAQRDAPKPAGTRPVNTAKAIKQSLHKPCSKDLIAKSKQATQRTSSSSDDHDQSQAGPSDADSQAIPEEMWIPSPLLPAWSALQSKQRRLWDQVWAKSTQIIPEKVHFTQKLQSTFAKEMPSEAPADAGAGLDCLTELSRALQQCHSHEVHLNQSSSDTLSGDTGRGRQSGAMLHGLEERMMGVLAHIEQLTTDLDDHYGWKPGALCPVRRRGVWGSPASSCLPSTVCYANPAQLQELAYLRLRVQLLDQETQLQQVLQDLLSAGLPPSSAAQLRGQYSLLAEGGLHFPTLVMDTDPE